MSAKILDGKKLSEKILNNLKDDISKLNKPLTLAIVLVGDDASSAVYAKRKKQIGQKQGVDVQIQKYSSDIDTETLLGKVKALNENKNITGIIVQLPLPEQIDTNVVLGGISAEKDVDVLTPHRDEVLKILPPTVAGIVRILEEYKIGVKGKTIAVVGQGRLVGKPASYVFSKMGGDVIAIDEFTENKEVLIKKADIVISGVGKPNLITKDMVKEGAVVIDAGTTIDNGKLVGDTSDDVQEVASYITPVPGGVGPMTVAMLFYNLYNLSSTPPGSS